MKIYNPTNLFYLINFKCNQKCSKCSHWKLPSYSKILDSSLLIKNIKQLENLKEFCIVGGEPLIFKNEIIDIIKGIKEIDVRTVIVTNGLEMDNDFIDEIKTANIHIVVSIDTLDKKIWNYVRGTDSYDKVIKNLNYAIKTLTADMISIQSVLAEETKESVEKVKEFCKENNIYHSIQLYLEDGFNGNWTPIKNKKIQSNLNIKEKCFAVNRNLSIMPDGKVFTCFQQSLISECEKTIREYQKSMFK